MSFELDWQVFRQRKDLVQKKYPDNPMRYSVLSDSVELSIVDMDGQLVFSEISNEQIFQDFGGFEEFAIEFLRGENVYEVFTDLDDGSIEEEDSLFPEEEIGLE